MFDQFCSQDALESGEFGVQFGNDLFMADQYPKPYGNGQGYDFYGLDRIAACQFAPLMPRLPQVNREKFAEKNAEIVQLISEIPDANSWSELTTKFMKVSTSAASDAYGDAVNLFKSLVVRGNRTTFISGMLFDRCLAGFRMYSI